MHREFGADSQAQQATEGRVPNIRPQPAVEPCPVSKEEQGDQETDHCCMKCGRSSTAKERAVRQPTSSPAHRESQFNSPPKKLTERKPSLPSLVGFERGGRRQSFSLGHRAGFEVRTRQEPEKPELHTDKKHKGAGAGRRERSPPYRRRSTSQ